MAENQSFFRKIFSKKAEKRSFMNDYLSALWSTFAPNSSGEVVNTDTAMKLSAVYTCINVLSETVAALKCGVFKTGEDGIQQKRTHPVNLLLEKEPNRYMTSFNFMKALVVNLFGWGNAYALVIRGSDYKPTSLRIITPSDVKVKEISGEYFYYVKGALVSDADILHFRLFSYDGINGISPITQNAETLGVAIKEQKFRGNSLKSRITGFLSFGQTLDQTQREQNKKAWQSQIDDGGTPVLSGDAKYNPLMLSPADAQIIDSIKASKEDIYGIFRVPPNLAQSYESSSYKGGEIQDLQFIKHTLNPILECLEQEFNKKMFTESEKRNANPPYVNFNIDTLLRGDIKTRKEYYESGIKNGYLSPNDVRKMEGLGKTDAGDIYVMQGAMTTLNNIEEGVNYTNESTCKSEEEIEKEPKEEIIEE